MTIRAMLPSKEGSAPPTPRSSWDVLHARGTCGRACAEWTRGRTKIKTRSIWTTSIDTFLREKRARAGYARRLNRGTISFAMTSGYKLVFEVGRREQDA